MADRSTPSSFATFLATAQGRLITALTIVALLLGIVAEVISVMTGYYSMVKVQVESQVMTSPGVLPIATADGTLVPGTPANTKAAMEARAAAAPPPTPSAPRANLRTITIPSKDKCEPLLSGEGEEAVRDCKLAFLTGIAKGHPIPKYEYAYQP
jgi:hypothetical protein